MIQYDCLFDGHKNGGVGYGVGCFNDFEKV